MFQLKWLVLDIFLPIFRKEITNFLRAPQEDNKKSCKNIYPWPAPAREHSSEGFEPRKVIEVKEEDDEENAIEVEIETN